MKAAIAIVGLCVLALAALTAGGSAFSIDSERINAAIQQMGWGPWIMVGGIGLFGTVCSLLASASKPRTAFVALFASWLPTGGSLAGFMTLTLVDTTTSPNAGTAAAGIVLILCLSLTALLAAFLSRIPSWLRSKIMGNAPAAT